MSIITKRDIVDSIEKGDLAFDPPVDTLQLRPHSVDLRLGFKFRVPKRATDEEQGRFAVNLDHYAIHNGQFAYYEEVALEPGQHFDILPEESVMGFSMEKIDIKSKTLMGELFPRSSVSRRGLAIDLTGIIDTGYQGHLMFPIRNNTSVQVIRIYPGERICQLLFHRLERPVEEGYQGRYLRSKKGLAPTFQPEAVEDETILLRQGKIDEIKRKFKHNQT